MELGNMAGGKKSLVLDQKDNVGIALVDLAAGDTCLVTEAAGRQYQAVVLEGIPFGHKFALADISKNAAVYKYGEEIGRMKEEVKKGGWIHSHNMYCDRGMK
jgi:altronate dehydratase small subunit